MAPHIDLCKRTPGSKRGASTRTLLLYLGDCGSGGETVLLEREGATLEKSGEILATVAPRSGRIFAFPHKCPHAGLKVVDAPKILLRGELY
jgi:hypothetical protein